MINLYAVCNKNGYPLIRVFPETVGVGEMAMIFPNELLAADYVRKYCIPENVGIKKISVSSMRHD